MLSTAYCLPHTAYRLLFTNEVPRVVDAARALVLRGHRPRTQRTRTIDLAIPNARGVDLFWRFAAVSPTIERSSHVERARAVAPPAVSHSRNHEDAYRVFPTARLLLNLAEVLDEISGGNAGFRPALIHDELPAMFGESADIGTCRIEDQIGSFAGP